VGLAEIHGFKWIIDRFSLVFAGLCKSRSIVRSTGLGWLKRLFGRFVVVCTKLEIDFIRENRA